ncbi:MULTISPECIES: ABC transporter permease subunit [Streptomyces]|uniref:Branched-chain amino acid ABC transporter permease n=1 Tax=Streptomyces doudnae TaxID=3075536 RepID=A0ABD5ELC3_9ACTN|nr:MULTISPECIES: branched-chain amino acid ABC transporter permease [unclassified Streptomyces]MDT0435482.1 branched-chain amino acid ABC transporter permease [Streptomyces sp. DSM 41981]MYQ67886.1 branched-chain amino acid ABC transporter permease [Streptomyces sp. SID4950]SCE41061.1 branched-chain amino acid transport system permease protein [Streptomyces sp. SolWspMP-5a-2]
MGLLDAHLVPAVDGVAYGLLLFVVAAGLSLAFGTAGVLNLAHGTLYAIGAYAGAACGDGTWGGLVLGLAAGTAVAGAAGAGLSFAAFPLARRGHLAQALLTFGLALVGGDLLVQVFGADEPPVRVPGALDTSVTLLGHRYPAYRLGFIVMAVLLAAFGSWVLARTRAGAAVRAAADDPRMLAATGVSPRAVHLGVLTAAGALAGGAGVLGAPIIGPGPGTSENVLMLSLVVVVLGGLRSPWATLLAAVAVGEVQTLGVAVAPDLAPYLLFAAMAVALIARPRATEPPGGHDPSPTPAPDPLTWLRTRAKTLPWRRTRAKTPLGTGENAKGWDGVGRGTPASSPGRTGTGASLPERTGGKASLPGVALARRVAVPALVFGALLLLPGVLDAYTVSLAGSALALGLLAVSVTLLTGHAGLPTLGQTAPFAVGAYTTAVLAGAGWTAGPVQVVLAALAAVVFCLVTGPAVVRARSTTVLMITLAVGELASAVAGRLTSVTGGADGLVGFPPTRALWGTAGMVEERDVYTYALVVTALAVAVTLLVLRSPAGRLLAGARGAEARMRASGHPVGRYLLVAYVGAGALAGIGGSLTVTVQQYLSPADVGFEIAAFALLAAVIGGTTSVVGALCGAALIVLTRDWVAGAWPGHGPLLLGVLFVVAVYLLPRGLAGLRRGPNDAAAGGHALLPAPAAPPNDKVPT